MLKTKQQNMSEKICMVTGATAGIGKIVATNLAVQGAEVIIVARNQQKAEETVKQIIAVTGNESVRYLLADFSDLGQVRTLVKSFKEQYSRLDILVNNAGAFFNTRNPVPFGVEMTFLVNHLAPFLLTDLLLDSLHAAGSARIVNVSSDAHTQGKINFDNLSFAKGYFGMKAYAQSKLANILFTYELARRLPDNTITVNALHPGHVATDIWKTNFSFIGPALKWIIGVFGLTPEQGADNTIYLASSPEVEGITGKYFDKREAVNSSPLSYDEGLAQKLWELSERLTQEVAISI